LHAWSGGLNERDVCEELRMDGMDWKGVKWTDLAQNGEKLQADVDPVIERSVSIKLRISLAGDIVPRRTLWSSLIVT
jgi:hypothetical protein